MSSPLTEKELQELLKKLLQEPECEFIEFKKSNNVNFGQYLSALSNGACLRNKDFGYLVFGVDDKNKKIIGTTISKGQLDRVAIKAKLDPKIHYSTHQFDYKGQKVILVEIARAQGVPTYYDGQAYVRIGEDKTNLKNLSENQIRRIYNSAIDWSAEIAPQASIADLDEEAIKLARKQFKAQAENKKYVNEIKNWSDEEFLEKADFTTQGKITNCALILLGKREARQFLKDSGASEILWELQKEDGSRISYERFYPPFLLSIGEAAKRIRNLKYLHPTPDLINLEFPKYEDETIIEALNNCIAHQDYFWNDRGVVLYEQPDILIFENYGNFFEGKPEEYVLTIKKAQKYRNGKLVRAMINIGMIDKIGSGIKKMYLAQKKRFFPLPDYSESNSEKTVLKIYGKSINENFSRILMENPDFDLTSVILLDHVQKNIPITDDAAKMLKKKGFIDGRKPKYFVSAKVATLLNEEEEYYEKVGASNKQLGDWILNRLEKSGKSTRKQIDAHVKKFIGTMFTEEQQKKKIENILQKLSRKGIVKNIGSTRDSEWIKIGNK